jgi:hypothetical protein
MNIDWSKRQTEADRNAPPTNAELDAEIDVLDDKMRAVVRWVAGLHGKTMQEARAELRPIYRNIRRS